MAGKMIESLEGKPLPLITSFLRDLGAKEAPIFLMLASMPTLLASIYLWWEIAAQGEMARKVAYFTAVAVSMMGLCLCLLTFVTVGFGSFFCHVYAGMGALKTAG